MIFSHRLDFLERLNRTIVDGKPLAEYKIFDKYNVWNFYQNAIFYSDLNGPALSPAEKSTNPKFKNFVLRTFVGFISLISVLKIIWGRPRVLVFSIDKANSKVAKNDARLDPLYRSLLANHSRFSEIFHALPGRGLIKNFWARRRLAIYDLALNSLIPDSVLESPDLDLRLFSEEEKPLARQIILKYLRQIPRTIFRVKAYSLLLRHSKVKAIYTIDSPRDYSELVLAANLRQIPVYAFQHGHYTKYHVGFLTSSIFKGEIVRPDRLYVWSEYWKKELLRLGTYFKPDEIFIGGSKGLLP